MYLSDIGREAGQVLLEALSKIGLCGLDDLRLKIILQLLRDAGNILLLPGLVVKCLEDLLIHHPLHPREDSQSNAAAGRWEAVGATQAACAHNQQLLSPHDGAAMHAYAALACPGERCNVTCTACHEGAPELQNISSSTTPALIACPVEMATAHKVSTLSDRGTALPKIGLCLFDNLRLQIVLQLLMMLALFPYCICKTTGRPPHSPSLRSRLHSEPAAAAGACDACGGAFLLSGKPAGRENTCSRICSHHCCMTACALRHGREEMLFNSPVKASYGGLLHAAMPCAVGWHTVA